MAQPDAMEIKYARFYFSQEKFCHDKISDLGDHAEQEVESRLVTELTSRFQYSTTIISMPHP